MCGISSGRDRKECQCGDNEYGKGVSIDATNDNTAEDDLNNVDEAIDDILVAEILLERAKISFQYVFLINIALELILGITCKSTKITLA